MADQYNGPISTASNVTVATDSASVPDPALATQCEAEAMMWKNIWTRTEKARYEWDSAIIHKEVANAIKSGEATSAGLLSLIQSWSSTPIVISSAEAVSDFWTKFHDSTKTLRLSEAGKAEVTGTYDWASKDGLMTDEQIKEDLTELRKLAAVRSRFAEGLPKLLRESAARCGREPERADWQADLASGRLSNHSQNSKDELRTLIKTYLASSLPHHAIGLKGLGYY